MAVFHPQSVTCACGNTVTVLLADSVNAKRSPQSRERILRGELHRAACSNCKREMTVEKPFYYTDVERNSLFKVLPRGERHTWKKASQDLDRAAGYFPKDIGDPGKRSLRVIFGMDELREKLIAQDAGLDDRKLELLKVLLTYDHPVLLRRSRLRLVLDKVTTSDLEFTAAYEHDKRRFRLSMPRRIADDLSGNAGKLEAWNAKAHATPLTEVPDHWVNMWRWSPQPTALDRLKAFAADAKAGKVIDTTSQPFVQMLAGIPRGSHLPSWAKQDLLALFEYAKKNNLQKLEDQLFEIRFGFELDDDWSTNADTDDIDSLWKLLKNLPDTNVEGNTKIHELLLDEGGGGTYSPSSNDIAIGSDELANQERFENVVRHEVGHAVHEQRDAEITGWLAQRFGWRTFGRTDADIDTWVGLMGGWGTLTEAQRRDVRGALKTALGSGSRWEPGPTPSLPPAHPWYSADFGPRLAFVRSGAYWFRNYKTWFRANGKGFFLNYWYQTLIAVDQPTLELIEKMPDDYAAMSHFEFFAELYALYYDLDSAARADVPADVGAWLDENIGKPEANAPMRPAMRPKREWETITRPEKKKRVHATKPPASKPPPAKAKGRKTRAG